MNEQFVIVDKPGLVFMSFAFLVTVWAVFDTERVLRLLSYNRKKTFTRFQLLVIKVPGTVAMLGAVFLLLNT
jgi:hypothetical protein